MSRLSWVMEAHRIQCGSCGAFVKDRDGDPEPHAPDCRVFEIEQKTATWASREFYHAQEHQRELG